MFANFCAQSLKLSRAEVWSERIDRSGRLRLEYSAEILKEILEEILEEVLEETGFRFLFLTPRGPLVQICTKRLKSTENDCKPGKSLKQGSHQIL